MSKTVKIILLFLIITSDFAHANGDTLSLDFFGHKPPKGDTIPFFDLFDDYNCTWRIQLFDDKGLLSDKITKEPDTLNYKNCKLAIYTTVIKISPKILQQPHGLQYHINGSLSFEINNKIILQTGIFVKDKSSELANLYQDNYLTFNLQDSLLKVTLKYYLDDESNYKLFLKIGSEQWAKLAAREKLNENNMCYALGFYFLAFAILLSIFYYYSRTQTETFYFALFCFFFSICNLTDILEQAVNIKAINRLSLMLTAEFLSFFFAKVMLNITKTRIPLLLIFVIGIMDQTSFFRNFDEFILRFMDIDAHISFLLFGCMLFYSFVSCLYYWLQGFGQKKWEAKFITYGWFVAFILHVIGPFVIEYFYGVPNKNSSSLIADNTSNLGFCLYPLVVAFVIGRRNLLTQKKLTDQLEANKQLITENLEREIEKKRILEDQNLLLEERVEARTFELAKTNSIITIKNKEITDNITYAQKIQAAILPDTKLIYKVLKQCFILYLPKDIVSGDFYSFSQTESKIIIASADCTGHGVSGALMSMISSSLLRQIISEKNILTPSVILDELNEGIIYSLNQKENSSNDGLDIAICSLDIASSSLEYAGANRPLWLIRNGELMVLHPDKCPIGGRQIVQEKKFTNHTIEIEKNDTIYFFTDGYADQFGMETGKKMMTKKLKELLLSIQHLDMLEQENFLASFFHSWKGNEEQVDDVLFIGIRF